jgi:hypothetical protein
MTRLSPDDEAPAPTASRFDNISLEEAEEVFRNSTEAAEDDDGGEQIAKPTKVKRRLAPNA